MNVEKAGRYSSLALLGGFVVRELIKAHIRVPVMAIRLSRLQTLADTPQFLTLYFHPHYHNRTLLRDVVPLRANVQTSEAGKRTMDAVPIEIVGRGELFPNEISYSVYKLSKPSLNKVITHFAGLPDVVFVLLTPIPYGANNEYIAYELSGADGDRKPVSLNVPVERELLPDEENSSKRQQQPMVFAAATRTSRLVLNPSPPATMELSYA